MFFWFSEVGILSETSETCFLELSPTSLTRKSQLNAWNKYRAPSDLSIFVWSKGVNKYQKESLKYMLSMFSC